MRVHTKLRNETRNEEKGVCVHTPTLACVHTYYVYAGSHTSVCIHCSCTHIHIYNARTRTHRAVRRWKGAVAWREQLQCAPTQGAAVIREGTAVDRRHSQAKTILDQPTHFFLTLTYIYSFNQGECLHGRKSTVSSHLFGSRLMVFFLLLSGQASRAPEQAQCVQARQPNEWASTGAPRRCTRGCQGSRG